MNLCSVAASEAIGDFKRGDTILEDFRNIDDMDECELESAIQDMESEISEVEDFKQDCHDAALTASDHIDELQSQIRIMEERLEGLGNEEEDGDE